MPPVKSRLPGPNQVASASCIVGLELARQCDLTRQGTKRSSCRGRGLATHPGCADSTSGWFASKRTTSGCSATCRIIARVRLALSPKVARPSHSTVPPIDSMNSLIGLCSARILVRRCVRTRLSSRVRSSPNLAAPWWSWRISSASSGAGDVRLRRMPTSWNSPSATPGPARSSMGSIFEMAVRGPILSFPGLRAFFRRSSGGRSVGASARASAAGALAGITTTIGGAGSFVDAVAAAQEELMRQARLKVVASGRRAACLADHGCRAPLTRGTCATRACAATPQLSRDVSPPRASPLRGVARFSLRGAWGTSERKTALRCDRFPTRPGEELQSFANLASGTERPLSRTNPRGSR